MIFDHRTVCARVDTNDDASVSKICSTLTIQEETRLNNDGVLIYAQTCCSHTIGGGASSGGDILVTLHNLSNVMPDARRSIKSDNGTMSARNDTKEDAQRVQDLLHLDDLRKIRVRTTTEGARGVERFLWASFDRYYT